MVSIEPGIARRKLLRHEFPKAEDLGSIEDLSEASKRDDVNYFEIQFKDIVCQTNRALNAYFCRTPDIANDWWTLEAIHQHYGPATLSLDLTTDPAVALFFATHAFKQFETREATYMPTTQPSIVYVFQLPNELNADEVWSPLRPQWIDLKQTFSMDQNLRAYRQSAILFKPEPASLLGGASILEVIGSFVVKKLIIAPNAHFMCLSRKGQLLPTAPDLFPGPEVDRLYAHLLRESPLFTRYRW